MKNQVFIYNPVCLELIHPFTEVGFLPNSKNINIMLIVDSYPKWEYEYGDPGAFF